MLSNFPNLHFPQMKRVKQISMSHCGPAVLKMLLSFQHQGVQQKSIVEAAGIEQRIKSHGMTVLQMAVAVKALVPEVEFWYKDKATIDDLEELVMIHKHPVGVEWQGVFEEYADKDNGHYGVAVHVDTVNQVVVVADSFFKFAGTDRHFNLGEFEKRWWDTNEVVNQKTGKKELELDYHMLFIVTAKTALFPEALGMVQG